MNHNNLLGLSIGDDHPQYVRLKYLSDLLAGGVLPVGTGAGNLLRWDGAAWVEEAIMVVSAGGLVTIVSGLGLLVNFVEVQDSLLLDISNQTEKLVVKKASNATVFEVDSSNDWIKLFGGVVLKTSSTAVSATLSTKVGYLGLTAATLTITLPPVANVLDGHTVIIKDENTAGGHTLDGNAAELIDGALTQPLGALAAATLVMRNGGWWIS